MIYLYNGELYCEDCARNIMNELPQPEDDLHLWDSNAYPYPWGNEFEPYQSDTPEHCAHCRVFLETDLTPEGREYVKERIHEFITGGYGNEEVLREWAGFYGIPFLPKLDR